MTILNEEALLDRAGDLDDAGFNGIKLVLVRTIDHSLEPPEADLEVHFHNNIELSSILGETTGPHVIFPISGGHRVTAGDDAGQVRVIDISDDITDDNILVLKISPIGDYSTYTLRIDYRNMDPIFSEINFKFRPGCFNLCAPEWDPAPEPKKDPVIDYLAKDYDSFRHTLISAMMERVPGWAPTSEADFDQVLLELFSAAADELSDYQDRVMNEAYFVTARKRVSLARHARLMDYHIHQGNQAKTWLALKIAEDEAFDLPGGFQVWAGNESEDSSSVVFITYEQQPLFFLNIGYQDDLNAEEFTEGIRNVFEENGIFLSLNINISVKESPGSEWVITDEDNIRTYYIRNAEDNLKVFAPHLHHLLNELRLYTWNNSIPALSAGSTHADLKVSDGLEASADELRNLFCSHGVTHILIQEELNPLTGKRTGRDPARKQLLKLLSGDDAAETMFDPLTGEWFVRVRWEENDKLKNDYCFTINCEEGIVEDVSLFCGNLVEVYHGHKVTVTFKDLEVTLANPDEFHFERTEKWGTICRLPQEPLAYKNTPQGGEVPPESTLEVKVETSEGGTIKWNEVISLIHSDEDDEHFMVETDEDKKSRICFGNGINGSKLPDNAVVHCSYQIGKGPEGNVGAEKLKNFNRDDYSQIEECWNLFNVTAGTAPEPVDEIIRRVPEAYRFRQLRAVTLRDYIDRAEELIEVSKASARYAWTGSWKTVRITIDPAGSVEMDDELRKKIASHLDAVRLIGEDLEIRPPRFVPLEINVTMCIHSDYWPEDIKSILEQEFSDGFTPDGRQAFFHPDLWTFGQVLRNSQIIGRVQSIEGVDHVVSVTIKRWNDVISGTGEIIKVGPDEVIQIRNDPDHREKGYIFFDPRGGRE
ncbi:MAG: baseplate J/gp47 family protein [Methanosarcinales archaeon]|nr:baseplate J/gp47 family protein [Methanosarcinales archaeon]